MGAWIETLSIYSNSCVNFVAPFMGAWIETQVKQCGRGEPLRRTLHGCVD